MSNPLDQVRRTCHAVCQEATHVSMNMDKINELATRMTLQLKEAREPPAWDADGWHYCEDAKDGGPITCHYIFVLDCLNFCFWPVDGLEYEQVAVGLKNAFNSKLELFEPRNLATISEEDVSNIIGPKLVWPLLKERVARLHELGNVLLEEMELMSKNGQPIKRNGLEAASHLVSRAGNSSATLVQLLLSKFSGFRDSGIYKGMLVHYNKRVQILVADLWAAYGKCTDGSYGFNDIANLTTFPDYRVPQLLRHLGCIQYSSELSRKVDGNIELPAGCHEEAEIRAFTVEAVEELKSKIAELGAKDNVKEAQNITSVEVDWLLWQEGENCHLEGTIAPPHHILTIFY